MKLNNNDRTLIEMATQVAKDNADIQPLMTVIFASIVQAKSGKIYKGINIKTSHSICAEQVAIGQAFACGERELDTIVTVELDNETKDCYVVSPCGLCRYTFDKLHLQDLNVIVKDTNNQIVKVKANELLPYPYKRNNI